MSIKNKRELYYYLNKILSITPKPRAATVFCFLSGSGGLKRLSERLLRTPSETVTIT